MKSVLFLVVTLFLSIGITGAVLYSMGDGDNQGTSRASIVVEGSPKEVFEWVSSPSYSSRWIFEMKKSKKVTKGKLKVGSIVRETLKVPHATAEVTGTVLKLKENKLIETKYYVSGMKLKRGEMVPKKRDEYATQSFISRIELEEVSEKETRVNYSIKATYRTWYTRFLEPLVTSDTEEDMEKSLNTLKIKLKKSAESREKKRREKEERLKKRKKQNIQKNVKAAKIKKGLKSPINPTELMLAPKKLKPMLKLNPKGDTK